MVEVPCLHAGIKSGESINHNYESAIGRATLSEYTNINLIMESRCARVCARTCKKWHNAHEEAHKSFGFSDMKSLTIMVSRYREGCQKLFRDCVRQIIWFMLRAIGHRFRHKLRTIWMLSFWKCVDFSRCVNVNDVSQNWNSEQSSFKRCMKSAPFQHCDVCSYYQSAVGSCSCFSVCRVEPFYLNDAVPTHANANA